MSNLTDEQLGRLKHMLDDRYKQLIEDVRSELIRSDQQRYIDMAGAVADVGDASVADLLADMDTAIIDRQIQEIRDIEAAKRRIADGSYGTCIDCGGDIGYERLLAYPTAKRCYECQKQHEKKYAREGTPTL
ncbi:MAG: TraR/DksA C4-type zinc finger protein [Pseudomonadota bacterium]